MAAVELCLCRVPSLDSFRTFAAKRVNVAAWVSASCAASGTLSRASEI